MVSANPHRQAHTAPLGCSHGSELWPSTSYLPGDWFQPPILLKAPLPSNLSVTSLHHPSQLKQTCRAWLQFYLITENTNRQHELKEREKENVASATKWSRAVMGERGQWMKVSSWFWKESKNTRRSWVREAGAKEETSRETLANTQRGSRKGLFPYPHYMLLIIHSNSSVWSNCAHIILFRKVPSSFSLSGRNTLAQHEREPFNSFPSLVLSIPFKVLGTSVSSSVH